MSKQGLKPLAAGLLGALMLATPALAQDDRSNWPDSLKVGTASQGGTYFIYGAGWAGLVQQDLGVPTSTEVTGGPVQNFALVQAGDLDLAMTTMGPAYDAWTGESPIAPGVEMKDVRATFPMYQTPFQIIALESSGIDSIDDLAGKRVGVGPQGGTPGTYFPRMFEVLGIDVQPQYGGAADLASQLQDGLIDAFAFGAGLPIAAFSQVEAQVPVTYLTFTDEQREQLLAEMPSLAPFTIPADTYAGLNEDQETVAMWNFGIAHKDLPESLVYEIMKTVLDDNQRMVGIHNSAEETLAENVDKNSFLTFHPGAVKYYREKGLEIDEAVLPSEMQ